GSNTPTIVTSNSMPTICVGQTSTLTVSGVSSYTWSDGTVNTALIVSPSVTTSYTVVADSSSGCSDTAVVTQVVSLCTMIAKPAIWESKMQVYPLPATEFVYIEMENIDINDIMDWKLLDAIGREYTMIYEKIDRSILKIKVSNLVNGQYALFFRTNEVAYYAKVIIQN
ncbi:MAG: hypothetical protein ACXVO9_15610, partial [Bacteroidia bacterium]